MQLTVVIPTHNRPRMLFSLLKSIQQQTLSVSQFEVLVVGNCFDPKLKKLWDSQGGTALENWQLHFTNKLGVNIARNLGARLAQSNYVLFLDDDCYLHDVNYLSSLLDYLNNNSNTDVLGGGYLAPSNISYLSKTYFDIANQWFDCSDEALPHLMGGNTCYKKQIFLDNHFFDEDIIFGGAETEFNRRLYELGYVFRREKNLCVEHHVQVNFLDFCKKAFLQGQRAGPLSQKIIVDNSSPQSQKGVWGKFYRQLFNLGWRWTLCKQSNPTKSERNLRWKFLSTEINRLFALLTNKWRRIEDRERVFNTTFSRRVFQLPMGDILRGPIYLPTRSEFKQQLLKAKAYKYQQVLLHPEVVESYGVDFVVSEVKLQGLTPLIQLSCHGSLADLQYWHQQGCAIHFTLSEPEDIKGEIINFLLDHKVNVDVTLVYQSQKKMSTLLKVLPHELLKQCYIYFPLGADVSGRVLSASKVHHLSRRLRARMSQEGTQGFVYGPNGFNNYNDSIDPECDLHPLCPPQWQQKTKESGEIEISVIIPAYNPGSHIFAVLKHLCLQQLEAHKYEIIVVDDGSEPAVGENLRECIKNYDINFKYIYFSRQLSASKKDMRFRAGIARNLGVIYAEGPILSFLDADILVPQEYLVSVLLEAGTQTVVQCRRRMLNAQASTSLCDYTAIDLKRDVYLEEEYWEDFKNTKNWEQMYNHWKYTCTYSLTLPRTLFEQAGWFRPTFAAYGFEDTDLGFRLARMGSTFLLSKIDVYHLFPNRKEFDYHHDARARDKTLAVTARIFYFAHLSPAIYRDLYWYLVIAPSWATSIRANLWRIKIPLYWALVFYYKMIRPVIFKPYYWARASRLINGLRL